MASTMKFDVFKVSFHPLNLVNNLKCFQYCFAAALFPTVWSVMVVFEKKKKKVEVGIRASSLEAGFTYLH